MTKVEKAVYLILALIALGYVSLRAYLNPLINDEAYTFLYFVWTDKFIPFDTLFWSANNHPLNSFFTWVCYKLFGMDEWALRLPNVLAFVLFTYYTFKFGTLFKNFIIRWSFWICILATPYLLELFGYSRGYGLSIAFFTAAIWHFIKAIESQNLLKDWKTWLFMTLALFSNLNLINSYFIWIMLFAFFSFSKIHWLKWAFNVLIRAGLLIFPIAIGLQLKAHSELYFASGTLRTVFHTFLESIFGHLAPYWDIVPIVLLILTTVSLLANIPSFLKQKNYAFLIVATFLVFNLTISFVQFWWLDLGLPKGRTTMHLYFLYIGSSFLLINHLQTFNLWVSRALAILLLLIPAAQFSKYNLYSSSNLDWKLEQFSDDFYKDIVKLQKENNQLLTLESNVLFNKHVYDYLNMKNGTQLNDLQYASDITHSLADVVLLADFHGQFHAEEYNLISRDKHNGTSLFKRNESVNTKLVCSKQLTEPNKVENQYYNLGQIELDTLRGASLRFSISANITAPSPPHLLYTTIELKDSIGQIITGEQIEITPLKKDWGMPQTTKFSFTWYNIPVSATLAEVYIRNVRKPNIEVKSAECTIFKLD